MKDIQIKWLGFISGGQLVGGTIIRVRSHWFWGKQYQIAYRENVYGFSHMYTLKKIKWIKESKIVWDKNV